MTDKTLTALTEAGSIASTDLVYGKVGANSRKVPVSVLTTQIASAANVNAAGAVMESDYNAQTVLVAVADNTPLPVTVGASTFVGRKASGDAGVMSATEARAVLNVEDGATADQTAAEILTALLTVDGAGSLLDADLLDGQSSAFYATATGLSDHLADAADAHDASAISFVASGDIVATDVQAAIAELDTEKQPRDADLTALATLAATAGMLARTGADAFAVRTIAGTANQISVANGDGASANPTLSLPADVLIPTVLTVPNTGLHILDNDSTHDLIIVAGSNLSTDRMLTFITGNADRTLNISAANVTIGSFAASFLDDADEATFKATVNLEIGTDVQAFDAELSALAGLTSAADKVPYFTGAGTAAVADFTAYGRTLVALADETALEALIDTLPNLTSIQGLAVTFADAGFDVLSGWDNSAAAHKNLLLADILTEASPAAGDFVVIYGAEGDVRKVNWSGLPGAGGGIANVVEDTTPQLGGNLDLNTFLVGAASADDLTKLAALTATATELNFVDGVTSAIQTQLDAKQATLTFGIANTNALRVDDAAAADDQYARFTATGLEGRTEAEFKADFNLEIGTDVQAFDATLASLALLGTAADRLAYTTGVDTWAETPLTAFARSILDDANEATFKATVNLEANTDFYAPGGTDVPIADGGTGASTAADARTNLGAAASATTLTAGSGLTGGGDLSANRTVTVGAGTGITVNADDVAVATNQRTAAISFVIDGGGSAITTGIKGDLRIPFGCTITKATLLADQAGAIVIDIWKDTFANFPPADADSITASAPPTLTASDDESEDATLTGWTTAIAADDILRFNVDSVTTITRVTLILTVLKT